MRAISQRSARLVAQIEGVAICTTSGTMLLTDEQGEPVTPALMYDDARAVGTERTSAIVQAFAECSERNGYAVQPTWALAKLAWLLDAPERPPGATRLSHCGDFLGGWLAGHPVAADTSHALKSGYDLVRDRWPSDAFAAAELPVAVLPSVVRPGTTLGVVNTTASAVTGLPEGTPIVAGMTDGCASQIASGTVRAGEWNFALGTTFVLKGVSTSLLRGTAVYSHRHPDGGWLPGGASNSGAGALAAAFPGADFAAMDVDAARRLPTDIIRYPLATRGERFPFVCPEAEPFEIGDARDNTDRFAALLQGVAFVERLSIAYMASLGADVTGRYAITGGATASVLWNQVRADVLGRPLTVPCSPDAAFGMAVLAASGNGSLADAADTMVSPRQIIDPNPAQTARYLELYNGMVDELERRGYIDTALSRRARAA
jgi:sugar (pentulose or hexulose) kinase